MPDNNIPATAEVKVPETKAIPTKVPETKGMEFEKVPETKSIKQIVTKKLMDDDLEILFQFEIDSDGNSTFTVFKNNSAPEPPGEPKPIK
jgi:hypothetical protein